MTGFADLHIHTYYSDSTYTPEEVLQHAVAAGLDCIAITDHDTVEGVQPIRDLAVPYNVEVVSGVELSSEEEGRDIHVLGYFIDPENSALLSALRHFQDIRIERIHLMLEKLGQMGIHNITFEEVDAQTKADVVGRLHLAQLLIRKGWAADHREAFAKYLGEGAPAYVKKSRLNVREAMGLIHQAGGLAVLAHPMVTNVDHLIPRFAREGLDGLEVYYPHTYETITQYYERKADKYGLLRTGGSDAHGQHKNHTYIGKLKISYTLVDQMKKRLER
ncbi:MAG TPA: PHP domain-containing protein [Candidatus Omnitrophota bacterium]|nr:PHP domain-containing protein [Candidatus Omnitrophota bacterium]HQO57968.1 PHP domain-containing protein [Candidatus Omnitrophota bacterium]HQP11815.1 PHP domain-containing protein [Candidatus Omnitrophota bacterium]